MKDCETRQQDLKAYLDGELPPGQRIALRWHLMRCARCREERDAMMDISQSFKTGGSDTLDPALRDRILSSVTYSEAEPETPRRQPRRRTSPLMFVWGAAAAGVLAGVFLRPLLLHDAGLSFKSAAPASPNYVIDIQKQEKAKQIISPSGEQAGASQSALAPSPSKAPAALPLAIRKEKLDTFAPADDKATNEAMRKQEPARQVAAPAGKDAEERKAKVLPRNQILTNHIDSATNQSNQSQDYMSTDKAAGTADGGVNINKRNSQQSASQSQLQQTRDKKKASLKAQQNSHARNAVKVNAAEPSPNSAPGPAKK